MPQETLDTIRVKVLGFRNDLSLVIGVTGDEYYYKGYLGFRSSVHFIPLNKLVSFGGTEWRACESSFWNEPIERPSVSPQPPKADVGLNN